MNKELLSPEPGLFRQKCREYNLKITPQRAAIYEALRKAKDHPSADVIYERIRRVLPNVSFDTVYRTLLSFSEAGIVRLVEGYGEKKRFEPDVQPHHHCWCMKCHAIFDFKSDQYDALPIPDGIAKKFKVENTRVVLEGLCGKCRGLRPGR